MGSTTAISSLVMFYPDRTLLDVMLACAMHGFTLQVPPLHWFVDKLVRQAISKTASG